VDQGASGIGAGGKATEVTATAEGGSGMKECVVQLLMYDRDTREIFGAGSGTLTSDLGHILTAAHVVMDPYRTMALFYGRPHCTVLVAKYVADDKPPVVTWRARICSTDTALKQVVTRSSDPSKEDLKDLAVLQLNGNVTCSQPPVMKPDVQPVGFIAHEDNDIITGLHYLPCNATAAPKSGDTVRTYGYPADAGTPGSMRLVCADTIVATLADGFIKTDATNVAASGFSGGPMVNSTGEVVGVMSRDRNTRHNKGHTVNVSCFRQLSGQIHDEHGMPTDADLQYPQLQVCQPDKLHQLEQGLAAGVQGVSDQVARVDKGMRQQAGETRAALSDVERGVRTSLEANQQELREGIAQVAAVLESQRKQVLNTLYSHTVSCRYDTLYSHTLYPAGMAY
jgi:hypothetical protein